MAGAKGWLLEVLAASILCALADSLMPEGAVKRVGRLVCGLVLLCAVLSPVADLELEGSRAWLEDYFAGVERREAELEEQVSRERRAVIEEKCGAYIVDKAAELGLVCSARVTCREEDGLPDRAEVVGALDDGGRSQLEQLLQSDLGIPPERQVYIRGEELP